MKKAILIFLSLVLSLAMIVPSTTAVMADSEKESEPQPAVRAALMISTPSIAEVGQPVTITVFARYNNQPVAEAEVYALKTDKMAITADKKNYTTNTADYVASLDEEVIFLGETNNEGQVTYKFADSSRYMLAAFKSGYIPGFSQITITLSSTKRLYLKVPASTEVGNPVTVAVVERSSQEPVANAAVYARKIGDIGWPKPTGVISPRKPKVTSVFSKIIDFFVKPTTGNTTSTDAKVNKAEPAMAESAKIADEAQNAEELQKNGIPLGYTDDNGELVYTFNETGNYALAAIEEDYAPGFARINIVLADQKALGIKAPDKAEVNKPVTITVFERQTHQPVLNASVYALRIGDLLTAVPAEKPTTLILTPEPTPTTVPEVSVTAEAVKEKGISLGNTDDNGQVVYSFDKTGRYVLAAIEDDYLPGFARIGINQAGGPKALMMKVPSEAVMGEPVPIAVRERYSGEAIAQATIYALRLEEVDEANSFPFKADPSAADTTAREKLTEAVRSRGTNIGSTENNGILIHKFAQEGHYILVAIKDGYQPDFARIHISPKIIVPQKTEVAPRPMPLPTTKSK